MNNLFTQAKLWFVNGINAVSFMWEFLGQDPEKIN